MILIDRDLCIGCGACVGSCPTSSLELDEEGKSKCNADTCIGCEACISTCPVGAISVGETNENPNEKVFKEDENNENVSENGDVKNENNVKILHFFAEWCGPCKMIEPYLTTLENEGYDIEHIDIDSEGNKSANYDVLSIPTLIFLKDGKEVSRLIGYKDLDVIKEEYNKVKEGI